METKVVYLINGLPIGGAEAGLMHLLKSGFFGDRRVVVATILDDVQWDVPTSLERLTADKAMSASTMLRAMKALAALIRRERPTHLFLSLPQAILVGRPMKLLFPGLKIASFEHNTWVKGAYTWPMRLTSLLSDLTLGDCAETLAGMRPLYWRPRPEVVVPLVDGSRFISARGERPSEGPLNILCVGRLVPEKGHVRMVRSLARVRRNFRCAIVGEGPMRPAIEAEIEGCGLSNQVVMAGALLDWSPLAKRADVYCQASDFEGAALTVLEALGAGLPVISTPAGAIPSYAAAGAPVTITEDLTEAFEAFDRKAPRNAAEWFDARYGEAAQSTARDAVWSALAT